MTCKRNKETELPIQLALPFVARCVDTAVSQLTCHHQENKSFLVAVTMSHVSV
jgi:hypothetical protein